MAVASKTRAEKDRAAGPDFHAIGDYGFLSDCHTGALVASDGTVEWMCLPRFDSPSVFAALLDRGAGAFRFGPRGIRAPVARRYIPGTNVLETSWMTDTGWLVVRDALTLSPESGEDPTDVHARDLGSRDAEHLLVRTAGCVHGRVDVEAICEPAFDYGTEEASWSLVDKDRVAADAGQRLRLLGDIPLDLDGRTARGVRSLEEGETCFTCVSWREELGGPENAADAAARIECTEHLWRRWLEVGIFPDHPWRWFLQRSALALKGLTYEPTGGMVAALTTSLPETPGGERNWDYRYTWIRDATFTLWSLHVLGFDQEAREFMEFVAHLCHGKGPEAQIMFGIGGESELTERTLDHLSGYVGSRPVRIGNAAYDQRQNDAYGALLDSIYIHAKARDAVPKEMAPIVFEQAEAAAATWRLPDQGIWETRGKPKHYLSSKLMMWVALDRAARLARQYDRDELADAWAAEADAVRADVLERGVSERGVFRQHYETDALDASLLLIPLVRFLPPDDDRVPATVMAIADELTEHGLVLRYRVDETDDGLSGKEGTFTICSFWLVSALSEIGERRRAARLCESVLRHATPLGLYAEEIEALSGAQLGNYPQAFTHLALINAVSHVIADEQAGEREERSAVFTEMRAAGAAG